MASRDVRHLVPALQLALRQEIMPAILKGCLGLGFTAIISCTLRTTEEQAILYAKGRSAPGIYVHRKDGKPCPQSVCQRCAPDGLGHTVTGAKPGHTYHEYGHAVDLLILEHGKMTKNTDGVDDPCYRRLGELVDAAGLCWGGHWKRNPDGPHIECHPPGLTCTDAWRLAKTGKAA